MRKTAIYFTHVAAALKPGFALLCGHMIDERDEPTFTRFARASGDNDWAYVLGDLKQDLVYALTSRPSPTAIGGTDFFALGRNGVLRVAATGKEALDLSIPRKDRSGYLEGLCVTSDGALIVCGSQKEVLRYAGEQWQAIDDGLYEPFDGQNDSALFAIAETAPGVLLAVGTRGLVVRRLGSQPWQTLDAPTNLDLHAVLPDGAGGAWIAGDGGTLYRLSADAAQWHDHGDPDISTAGFDSLALHKGTLYVTAMNQLLQLPPGQTLQPVDGPFKPGSEFHSVSARGDYLWATGDEHVYRLGPEGWQYFLCPDNA
jgi:photosystem II stability/assembly factor-like uncharacterized protein